MRSGADVLLDAWTSSDHWMGLFVQYQREVTPRRGTYARVRIPGGSWTINEGVARAAEVRFSGFVTSEPILGFFLADAPKGEMVFPFSFIDGEARMLVTADDILWITPSIELREA